MNKLIYQLHWLLSSFLTFTYMDILTCPHHDDNSRDLHFHTVNADFLFDKSPEITLVSCHEFLVNRLKQIDVRRQSVPRGSNMQWLSYNRKASKNQRDGHLWRIKGVELLNSLILQASHYSDDCTWNFTIYGIEVDGFELFGQTHEHPCIMLAHNDMLHLKIWNQVNRKRKTFSRVPDGDLLRFAAHRCMYCSGKFDRFGYSMVTSHRQVSWDDACLDDISRKAPWLCRSTTSSRRKLILTSRTFIDGKSDDSERLAVFGDVFPDMKSVYDFSFWRLTDFSSTRRL